MVEPALTRELLLVAPHAVNHTRDGRRKLADRGTGGLAEVLAGELGCGAICQAGRDPSDAASEPFHPLKREISHWDPPLVVDIHGMSPDPSTEIDLGLGPWPKAAPLDLVDRLRTLGTSVGLLVTTNARFLGDRPHSITAYCQSLGMAAVQVELAPHLRPPRATQDALAALLNVLIETLLQACPDGRN